MTPRVIGEPLAKETLESAVAESLAATPALDIHTHLFPPEFDGLGLWGIDELLTYHYLEAELFRFGRIEPEQYWELSKSEQADLVWTNLFVENTPLSEAARGILAVLQAFGIDSNTRSLGPVRDFFRA